MSLHDHAPNCLIDGPRCEDWPKCQGCGFNRLDAERRLWAIRHGFMQKNKKGLRYLVIRREKQQ